MRIALTFTLFLLAACGVGLQAQNLNACPLPSFGGHPAGATRCTQSCIFCDFIGVEDTTNVFLPLPQLDLCLQMENPRWYGFIAGSTSITFLINPTFCNGGQGVQAAIYEACGSIKACNANAGSVVGSLPVAATGLTIGQAYQLLVDGVNGDVCGFKVVVADGSVSPPPLGPIGSIQGPTQICPDATATYSIAPVSYAASYTWTAPAGAKINGISNVLTVPANETSVEISFPGSVAGSICVSASNACNPPVQTCITVTNHPLPITQLDDVEVCFEQSPYEWPEEPHTLLFAPGTYTLTSTPYASYLGCDSMVRQKITILPKKQKSLGLVYLCNGDCFSVGPYDYCEAGTFQEIIPADNGCDSTVLFTIVELHAEAFAQVSDTITCDTPSVVLTSMGSSAGLGVSYLWFSPGGAVIASAPSVTVSAPGEYSLVVTQLGGGVACRDTAYVNVIAETTFPIANAGPPRVLNCVQTQAQLNGTASAGPQFTYFWTTTNGNIVSGANTLTPIVNQPGTYTLRVTNLSNGCVAHSNTTVTQTLAPPDVAVSGGTFNCTQTSVTLQLTTNAENPTIVWSGPNGFTSSQPNPTVSTGGDYTVVVTDGITGCVSTATATVVADNAAPGATVTGGDLTCLVDTVTLNAITSTPGVTFAWVGPNGFASTSQNPVVTQPGTYTLLVSAPNGCTSTAQAIVAQDTAAPGATLATSGNLNCNNSTVNLLVSSTTTTAPLDYIWTNPDGSTLNTGNLATLTVSQPGLYSVLVTNTETGCVSTASFTVVQNEEVTATTSAQIDVTCFGAANGSATILASGGNGAFTFDWPTGDSTGVVSGLSGGTYLVTVTDSEGCSATVTVTIAEPDVLDANTSATPQSSNGAADGTVTATPTGGTTPYEFIWSTGDATQTVTGLMPGSYTVTVTDDNGCTSVETATVNAYNCLISAAIQVNDVTCFGNADGAAAIDITGGTTPFTFEWSNGETSPTIDSLIPGQYGVTLTDAANCPIELTFTITEPNLLAANASATGTSGPNVNDGTATAGPTGGTAPYTFEWSSGDLTATTDSLAAGLYTVTVTDVNGCSAVQEVEVEAGNCGLLTNFVTLNPTCNGSTNGSATVVVTGGNAPFTFSWTSGGNAATENNLGAGTQTVTITDTLGCQVTALVTLTEPDALVLTVDSLTTTNCATSSEGMATVSATGGSGAISFDWTGGLSGSTITGLDAGNYTVTATDANGCTTTATVTILAVDQIAPVITTADSVAVALGQSGSVTLNLQNTGVLVADNCIVSSVNIDPNVFDCDDLGNHQVVIRATDDGGNISTDTITVNIIDDLVPTLNCPASIVRCFTDSHVVTYNAPTATDNCFGNGGSFDFVTGLLSGATFPVGTTTNTYSYTDAQGNVGSCSFEVTILTALAYNVVSVKPDIGDQGIGAIDISVSGSLAPYHFAWTRNGVALADTTEDLTGLTEGIYAVIITDDFGCTLQSNMIEVLGLVSTGEPAWAHSISIRPNPTSGSLFIGLADGLAQDVQLQLFDLTGRPVSVQTSRQAKQIDLDLSAMPSGVYTLMLRLDGKNVVRKVVVSK